MRNRDAARYARWSAIVAGLIVIGVVGLYAERSLRESRALRRAPKAVPVTVEQRSAQFSFSKVEQDRTIFTIRASSATQFKDQNRALLEDVWITIYGKDGSRNDDIHTHECSYEPESGAVRCEGDVEINMRDAAAPSGKAGPTSLEVKTSNLSFNRNTGEASTPSAVEFHFPTGSGRGVGANYDSHDGIVRVDHDVAFNMAPSEQTSGLPVTASGSSLEVRRNERKIVLNGPTVVKEGSRSISADSISVELDKTYHAQHVVADGHPRLHADEGRGKIDIAADHLEGFLNTAGWIERVVASGNITGTRQATAGIDHFSAQRVEFAMIPGRNLINDMTASGGVTAELHQGDDAHLLKTDAMRVKFSVAQPAADAKGKSHTEAADHQRVESAETLAPATIESKSASDSTTLRARQFVAQIGADGHLDRLLGHSGVEVRRVSGTSPAQTVTAAEMTATFDAKGQWKTVDESGNVVFQQADRQATAARASIARPTDTIRLEGSPVVSDSMSRTTAASVTINHTSGEIHATGGVVSTYVAAKQGDAIGLGAGAAHVSADALSGSLNSGHVTYAGHARLWQGDSVLDGERIEIWRDEKRLMAMGHVVAVFPQASGPLSSLPGHTAPNSASKPTLWKITAPSLTYANDQGRAHLEGGVTASSDQGSLASRTLDAFLSAPQGETPGSAGVVPGARQLSRVLAQGNVIVREGDRRGTAEQAEYTTTDGKFVLSGGQPTLANASSDTTTGHSLTFFVANDTILIDSQEGSRTVTKHRVEK